MSTIELEAHKAGFIRDVLNEPDENIVRLLITSFREMKVLTKDVPWQISVEELQEEVRQGVRDIESGNYLSMEEMRAKHPRI
jgi:hypothetical protein